MAEFPALPLFTDAYIADTRHLSAAQHGAYLLLLMMAWRLPDCALPDDDKLLSRWSAMTPSEWAKNKEIVMSFWRLLDDKWVQLRLKDERDYVEVKRNKNSRAGKASALKRLNRGSTFVQPESNINSTPTPTPTPTPILEERDTSYLSVKKNFDDDFFETYFWKIYPRKVAKGAAKKAFKAALKKTSQEEILSGLHRLIASSAGKEPQYIPHAATWLNAERWLDEAEFSTEKVNGKTTGINAPTTEGALARVDLVIAEIKRRENGTWEDCGGSDIEIIPPFKSS